MQNIVGTRIHDEILGMIDRAEAQVVLVSPFVRMWPELARAIARAVARGVGVSLITRGPKGGPRDEDLAVFVDLEANIDVVPGLHLKAYLSEKEAIHTSVNLTRESVDRSLESSLLFSRAEDLVGWTNVCEVWHKTLDDAARAVESPPLDVANIILVPLRERADRGDDNARQFHCYCIVCGATASEDRDQVVCVRCRAAAIARDVSPDALRGARCTCCNTLFPRSTAERPLCDACYRAEQERYDRRPADWYVDGQPAGIQAWSKGIQTDTQGLSDPCQRAVRRRWSLFIRPGGWLLGTVTATLGRPFSLWKAGMPPNIRDAAEVEGVLLERVPTTALPPCRDLPAIDGHQGLHVAFARAEAAPSVAYWVPDVTLGRWDVDLPRSPDPKALVPPQWIWQILLGVRATFPSGVRKEPGRTHLELHLDLQVPADLRPRWTEAATALQELMLASLHSYEESEILEWLGANPVAAGQIAARLCGPAPLGPGKLLRGARGKIKDIPSRPDRVVGVRVALVDGVGWHLTGAVVAVKKQTVH